MWEKDCSSNEIIIISLSQFLNLNFQLAFLANKQCQINKHAQTGEHQIILLIQPGHYNIGVNDFEMPSIIKNLQKAIQNLVENLNKYSKEVNQ